MASAQPPGEAEAPGATPASGPAMEAGAESCPCRGGPTPTQPPRQPPSRPRPPPRRGPLTTAGRRAPGCCWPAAAALRRRLRAALLRLAASLVSVAAALPVEGAEEAEDLHGRLADLQGRVADARTERQAQVCRSLSSPSRPIRIFIDGAFDLTHFGHMNAFRQARALGDHLIVGVNSDESVAAAKGMRPVMTDAERQAAVSACRFVDEIVPASPYVMTEEYIEGLVESHGVDFFVHGDDPCLVEGRDVYEAARKAGRFRTIPRTDGISTTDIVGRMLLLTRDHHESLLEPGAAGGGGGGNGEGPAERPPAFASRQSRFLVTSQLMKAFSAALPGRAHQATGGRTVYVDGAWDMFHAGHTALLERAHGLGEHLVVGVHSDAVVNQHRGSNYPLMAMHERVLSVLACRYVDDVLLDAPWVVTREMIATLRIDVVARGTVRDCADAAAAEPGDPHAVPKSLGIHVELESPVALTLEEITRRLQGRPEVSKRQKQKQQIEQSLFQQKHGLVP